MRRSSWMEVSWESEHQVPEKFWDMTKVFAIFWWPGDLTNLLILSPLPESTHSETHGPPDAFILGCGIHFWSRCIFMHFQLQRGSSEIRPPDQENLTPLSQAKLLERQDLIITPKPKGVAAGPEAHVVAFFLKSTWPSKKATCYLCHSWSWLMDDEWMINSY